MAKFRVKKAWRLSLIILILMGGTIAGLIWYQEKTGGLNFVRYEEFGIDMPVDYEIHGIDVSKFQKNINWEAVEQMQVENIHISFAFIKATEGITRQDANFKQNWSRAKRAGVVRGAYHFFYATRDPLKQAINFQNIVQLEPGDLPPVLDIEVSNNQPAAVIRSTARVWLEEMEKAYGVKPIIYTNVHFYETYLGDEFDDYPLWVAHYYQKKKPASARNWLFWQHNDGGRVNGINTTVDFNVFRGDSLAFSKLLIPAKKH
ncbi:glycoside hydrolase family 25 protein [Chitinophaga sp.]|uniref:glycoside hydrolase family 25 protein n=1 Tax=Chitinophaga sp. TaxID=1869181 RepID=UPI0031D9FC9A